MSPVFLRNSLRRYRGAAGAIGRKQEQYDFTKTCDLHYLLKHITQPATAPVYASGSFPRRLTSHALLCIASRIIMRANDISSAVCLLSNAAVPTPVILSFFQPFFTICHKSLEILGNPWKSREIFNFVFRVQGAQG